MRAGRLRVHVRLVRAADGSALADEVHDLVRVADGDVAEALPDDVPVLVLSDLDLAVPAAGIIVAEKINELLVVELDEGALDAVGP